MSDDLSEVVNETKKFNLSGGVKSTEETLFLKYQKPKYLLQINPGEFAHLYKDSNKNNNGDSGVNLFIPSLPIKVENGLIVINHNVKARMINIKTGELVSYYMYPRSSITKTGFALANSVGIIDAGYRGNLIAKIHNIGSSIESLEMLYETSLFQICAPDLKPIIVEIVTHNFEDDPEVEKARGTGGFGSTGRTV